MTQITTDRVLAAREALGSGDRQKMLEYWSEDVRFEIAGHHAHAGWYQGLDAFLGFCAEFGQAAGGTLGGELITVLAEGEWSVDLNRVTGVRAGAPTDSESPYHRLDIEALHIFRWADGRVVEGRWVILGDGLTALEQWFSPVGVR